MEPGRGRARCALWGGIALGTGTLAYALFSSSSAGCSTNLVVLTRSAVTARGCAAFSVVAHVGVGLIVLGAVLLLGSFALALRNRRATMTAPSAGPEVAPASTEAEEARPAPEGAPGGPADEAVASEAEAAPAPGVREPAPSHGTPEPVTARSTAGTREPVTATAAHDTPEPAPATTAAPGGVDPATSPTVADEPWGRPIAPGEDVYDHRVGEGSEDRDAGVGGLLGPTVRLPPGWYGNPNNPDRPVQWWDGTKLTDRRS